MDQKLDKKLVTDFPLLYKDRYGDMRTTAMCWGIEPKKGWFNLIYELSSKLEPLIEKYLKNNPNLPCSTCGCEKDRHYGSATSNPGKCLAIHKYSIHKYSRKYIKFLSGSAPLFFPFWLAVLYYRISDKIRNVLNWFLALFYSELHVCFCEKYDPSYPRASQVKEKYGCYDEETEVLTKAGWKFFKDITFNDEIASLEGNEFLEYRKPLDIISYKYSGAMYRLKTRGVDLLITPNHNLYVAKGSYYNGRYNPPKKMDYVFELITYEKYFNKNKRFKKSAIWNKKDIENVIIPGYSYSADFILTNKIVQNMPVERTYIKQDLQFEADSFFQFLGWYVAEGCSNIERGDIKIACNNTDAGAEKNIIQKILENCNFKIKTAMEEKPALTFNIHCKQLAKWLSKNCGSNSYEKKIPKLIKDASARQIELFLQSLFSGDGQKTETAYILTTVSKQLADDVQECLLKAGYSSRLYTPRPESTAIFPNGKTYKTAKVYEINWLMDSNYHNTQNKGLSSSSLEEIQNYDGQVYCVTVPENIIYVRRNGKPVWCGNSLCFYMTCATDEMYDLIQEYEKKSETICEDCGKEGKLRNDLGWILTLCDKHYKENQKRK
ncbi:MAG: LAGLIDADG family homing endonuclease [Nanoarchaeota archaeon]